MIFGIDFRVQEVCRNAVQENCSGGNNYYREQQTVLPLSPGYVVAGMIYNCLASLVHRVDPWSVRLPIVTVGRLYYTNIHVYSPLELAS